MTAAYLCSQIRAAGRERSRAARWHESPSPGVGVVTWCYPTDSFRRTTATMCVPPLDESVLERIHQERLARYARVFAKIDDKVVHVLKAIKRAGLKLGLISNCTPEEVAAWHTCCLAETFDDAVFSWQISRGRSGMQSLSSRFTLQRATGWG